jgi:hypothetical protein
MQTTITPSTRADSTARAVRLAGMYLVSKLRQQARDSGTYRAALNARKQGVPLSVALACLRGGV